MASYAGEEMGEILLHRVALGQEMIIFQASLCLFNFRRWGFLFFFPLPTRPLLSGILVEGPGGIAGVDDPVGRRGNQGNFV